MLSLSCRSPWCHVLSQELFPGGCAPHVWLYLPHNPNCDWWDFSIIHCCRRVFWTVNIVLALSDIKNIKFKLSGMLSLLSLLFPVFRGVTLASRLAHYLKSGKESVILSIHSLCLTDCVCWWEKGRAGREKKREGWCIWCLVGGWDFGEIQMQEWEGNQTKKKGKKGLNWSMFCRRNKADRRLRGKTGKNLCRVGLKRRPVL